MDALHKTFAHKFPRDGLQIVVKSDDMVAVPAHTPADVQQNLIQGHSTHEILSAMLSVG